MLACPFSCKGAHGQSCCSSTPYPWTKRVWADTWPHSWCCSEAKHHFAGANGLACDGGQVLTLGCWADALLPPLVTQSGHWRQAWYFLLDFTQTLPAFFTDAWLRAGWQFGFHVQWSGVGVVSPDCPRICRFLPGWPRSSCCSFVPGAAWAALGEIQCQLKRSRGWFRTSDPVRLINLWKNNFLLFL